MKKFNELQSYLTRLRGLMLTLIILCSIGSGNVWGQASTHTSNVTLNDGSNCNTCTISISGNSYGGKKLGASSKTGSTSFSVPAGVTTVYIHAAKWNGESGSLNITRSSGTVSPTSVTLTADGGVSGNSPFTLSDPAKATTDYFFTLTLSSVNSATTVTLTTSSKRAVVWGVNTASATKTFTLAVPTGAGGAYNTSKTGQQKTALTEANATSAVSCAAGLNGTYASMWTSTAIATPTYTYPSNVVTSSTADGDLPASGTTLYAVFTTNDEGKYTTNPVCNPACTEPTSVSITGTNKYLGGQTISLTAAPTGGTGTPSYQWQKKINGTWTNLANGGSISGATSNNLQISSCGYGNSGGYRCIVSTGEGCETKSHADNTDGYGVHVFSLNGGYYGGDWSAHDITWTSGTTGRATVHLNASSTYMFKVYSNHGYYYGNGENNYIIQPVSWDCGTGNNDMRLFTGPEGDYTFTVNIEHGLDNSPYVNVHVDYPTVSHPSTGYIYISKWWDCYVHYWEGTNNDLTPWGYDPKIDENRYAPICGNNYWYFPVIATYNKFIAKDNAGGPSNTTGDQVTTSHGGMYITHDGNAWVWRNFSTFTISYAGGGGTGSMSSHTNLCPGSSQALTANTFSRTHYTFDGWHANVNVKVGGSTITAGNKINNSVTLQDIQSNVNLTAQWAANSYTVTTNLTNVTPNTAFPASVTYTGTITTALNRTLTVNTTNFSLPSSITVTMAGTGTLTQGTHYTYNNSTGAFAFNVAVTGNITITATALPKYTVTLKDDNSTYTQASYGASVTLPSRAGCTGYTFAGWTKSWTEEQDEWTTTAPTIIPAGSYTPSSNENLYPVYTKTEGGGEPETVTIFEETCGTVSTSQIVTNVSKSDWSSTGIGMEGISVSGSAKTYTSTQNLSTAPNLGITSATIATFTISGINTSGYSNLKLSYRLKGNGTGTPKVYGTYSVSTNAASNNSIDLTAPASESVVSTDDDLADLALPVTNNMSLTFTATTDVTNKAIYLDNIKITGETGGSTTYYISVPDCCDNIVDLTAGATDATTHCTSLTFSNDNLPTCSDEHTDRRVTITVTPYDGYAAPAELTYSGAGTATYVSGPKGSGPYTYEYEFDKDDDGDGTFTATCTPKAISLVLDKNNSDVSGSANGSATIYFDATSLSTISHATRSGYVLDGYYAEQGCTNKVLTDAGALVNYTGYVVSGKWARATTPTTLYAKWIAKSFEDYKFTCAELTLEPHLVTDGTPIFITSTASKKVRSQDSIQITGSGLTPNTTLTFPGLPDKFEIKTATYGALSTDASGAIDVAAYIFYTPDAGSTTDGLDEIASITASVGGAKAKQVSLVQSIIGRHLPADFVIAGKKNDKWYALPATMSSTDHPAPAEIAVDDIDNPSIAYTDANNKYGLVGPTTGASSNISNGDGQYVKLTLHPLSDAPLFGQAPSSTAIGKSGDAIATNNLSAGWWWQLKQTNTSISNPQDAKYIIYCANNNTNHLRLKDNVGNPQWGLYDSGVEELRLIPASTVIPTEAEVVEWGLHAAIVEVNAQGVSATKVKAKLNGATSSLITLATTGTSVKGTATKYDYTVSFGDGIDFAAQSGKMLTLEWYNSSDVMVAVSNILVPKIIASSASMSSIESGDTPWSKWEVHVLPGVTLTANAGSFTSSDVTIKQLEIYQGATVNVTTGTLDVTKLVLRNGWRRVNGKAYEVARIYITPTDGNLTVTDAYADWYIDFDQYYPIAVPWDVTVSGMTYKNSNTTVSVGPGNSNTVRLRYYDGASRATNVQEGVSSGANWKAYGADGCTAVPAKLVPSVGYAMTAKRPTGKAFSIIRMPLTIPSSSWTAGGEQGYISPTHKDQVSITAHGSEETPEYAKGWNLIANPYMSLYQGTIEYAGGDKVNYVNIPDVDFKDYSQMPTALTKLKPASAFLVQAPSTGTVTFGSTNRKASAPDYRNNMKEETVPEQQAYININDESSSDMMGLWVADKYTAAYNANADLEKLLGEGTSLKTYMHFGDMDMAYLAINETLAKEWIPVLVRIPENGEYTFSLHDASTVDRLAGVYLIDHGNGDQVTNLITDNYTFFSTSGTISGRFAINATVGERMPTDVDVVNADEKNSSAPVKFIFHEKVYIMYNGVIYDATGKRVREVNK